MAEANQTICCDLRALSDELKFTSRPNYDLFGCDLRALSDELKLNTAAMARSSCCDLRALSDELKYIIHKERSH